MRGDMLRAIARPEGRQRDAETFFARSDGEEVIAGPQAEVRRSRSVSSPSGTSANASRAGAALEVAGQSKHPRQVISAGRLTPVVLGMRRGQPQTRAAVPARGGVNLTGSRSSGWRRRSRTPTVRLICASAAGARARERRRRACRARRSPAALRRVVDRSPDKGERRTQRHVGRLQQPGIESCRGRESPPDGELARVRKLGVEGRRDAPARQGGGAPSGQRLELVEQRRRATARGKGSHRIGSAGSATRKLRARAKSSV